MATSDTSLYTVSSILLVLYLLSCIWQHLYIYNAYRSLFQTKMASTDSLAVSILCVFDRGRPVFVRVQSCWCLECRQLVVGNGDRWQNVKRYFNRSLTQSRRLPDEFMAWGCIFTTILIVFHLHDSERTSQTSFAIATDSGRGHSDRLWSLIFYLSRLPPGDSATCLFTCLVLPSRVMTRVQSGPCPSYATMCYLNLACPRNKVILNI